VPSGEVHHGKAQDRFLNGWRKKTYEYEEIDPRWLTNSLTLELDAGRRLSNSSMGRPPLLLVSDETKAIRRRRHGRVEHVPPFSRRSSTSSKGKSPEPQSITTFPLPSAFGPNENLLSHIENEITKFERRRSYGNLTPSPTHTLGSPVEDLDISLTMTLPVANEDAEASDENEEGFQNGTLPIPNTVREQESEEYHSVLSGLNAPVTSSAEEHDDGDHLQLEPKYDPSSDERGEGDPPSPAFARKFIPSPSPTPTGQIEIERSGTTFEFSMPSLLIPPVPAVLSDDEGLNPLNLPIDSQPTFESNYKIPLPVLTDSVDGSSGPLLSSTESTSTGSSSKGTLEQGADAESDGDKDFGADFEDESLWLRTAAAFNPQSFNVIKRRISESN